MSSDFMRVLQKRDVNWCESGHGYPAFCPGPSDPSHYKYCCTFPYLKSYKPSCCMLPTDGIWLLTYCSSCIILFVFFIALYCWCWPSSRLNKRMNRTAPPPVISQDEIFPRRNSYKSSIPFD
ncbi:Protein CBG14157 [Caenorhabditis briggsae]|uniref:Uncharacterized protein n=2 Tax=Caenorhabditis briggsae TaxID=6238 RepID=A0AAE9JQ53_CAEBR|nr:Protein CBG14157 [Caenorhabditis briggsae]ULT81702.1 hypothetical protein L3Y34_011581 [Caenorhabditis briggsae]UMM41013.1 hypothetical protein L5515_017463 [Caenorhabditis briggsae]CAP32777.1 Protein CBG14157 [Caenorhabditis briggsae]